MLEQQESGQQSYSDQDLQIKVDEQPTREPQSCIGPICDGTL